MQPPQVYDYARHFLSSCCRLLPDDVGLSPSSVTYAGRTTAVGVFPIGIEPEAFLTIARSPACRERLGQLTAQFKGYRVVVSVDRLDPIKGASLSASQSHTVRHHVRARACPVV